MPLATAVEKPDFESTVVSAPETKKSRDNEDKIARNADGTPDFESTMVIAPDAQLSKKKPEEKATNSTDAFIDRVKSQLSNSDKSDDNKDNAFTSTTPV